MIRPEETVMTEIASRHQRRPESPARPAKDLELVACPECGNPAEIEWRDEVDSTHGAIEHLKIRCVDKHWFLMPADMLSTPDLP
jgi:hypothetical protein